jgi:hypothetical protein
MKSGTFSTTTGSAGSYTPPGSPVTQSVTLTATNLQYSACAPSVSFFFGFSFPFFVIAHPL